MAVLASKPATAAPAAAPRSCHLAARRRDAFWKIRMMLTALGSFGTMMHIGDVWRQARRVVTISANAFHRPCTW
jgi:hypothetical protein